MLASINGGGGHLDESALAQDAEGLRVTESAQWAQSGHYGQMERFRRLGAW